MGAGGTVSDPALTVLITNLILSGRSGTEIVVRNLARALHGLGHRPIVYSPRPGPIADELRDAAIPVVTDPHETLPRVDIIHGHHLPTTVAAMARFPETPAVFVCHDFVAWHDRPPLFPGVRRYVAVDETVAVRLRHDGAPLSRITVVVNQPDLTRFAQGPALPHRPRRALAFAKNRGHLEAITRACAARDISLEVVGQAVGRLIPDPERALPGVDLVFTSALSALEAMACGRGVIVCDGRGLAGWVSPARYDEWRRLNFGLATLTAPLTEEAVGSAIDRYDAGQAGIVAARVRSEGGVAAQAREYLAVYRAAIADDRWREDVESSRAALARYVQECASSELAARSNGHGGPVEGGGAELGLERVDPDVCYAFSEAGTDRCVRALSGVSPFDGTLRWTVGKSALIAMRVPEGGSWQLLLRVVPFLHGPHTRQRIGVEINGLLISERVFEGGGLGDPVPLIVPIPPDRVADDGLVRIRLTLPDAASPASLGLNGDPRRLGVALIDARLSN
jgi:hypothetical protein